LTIETEDTGEQPTVDKVTDLAEFEKDFYPHLKEKAPEPEPTEEVEEPDEEVEEDTTESEEVDDLAPEDEVEEEAPKPKKHNAQTRINELTAKARQAEREVEALRREMETLKAGREKEEEATPLRTQLPPEAPNPDAVDKDGQPLYELGEFDPKFIRDLTKFTIAEETKAAKEAEAKAEWEHGVAEAQKELAEHWVTKVAEAEVEIPTLRDDITSLTDTFEALDPNYGEYLAMTIMQCEAGPEIMHYFSQNIGEAQKIVASGPAAATLAIGRLEAKLAKPSTEREAQGNNKRVSNAPVPPDRGARGVSGRQNIRPDTNNLDDFEKIFYPKK
jgi:hypothetical protein